MEMTLRDWIAETLASEAAADDWVEFLSVPRAEYEAAGLDGFEPTSRAERPAKDVTRLVTGGDFDFYVTPKLDDEVVHTSYNDMYGTWTVVVVFD